MLLILLDGTYRDSIRHPEGFFEDASMDSYKVVVWILSGLLRDSQ